MSGASTEPCGGRRIPGLARWTLSVGLTAFGRSSRAPAGYEPCTEAMKRGQQLHPFRAPSEPQSGFLGRRRRREAAVGAFLAGAFTVQVQFLDKLVAVPAAQVSPVPPAPVVEIVVSHSAIVEKSSISYEPIFDKVADMPVGVWCSTLTRW